MENKKAIYIYYNHDKKNKIFRKLKTHKKLHYKNRNVNININYIIL